MKALAIAAGCLLSASLSSAECVVVMGAKRDLGLGHHRILAIGPEHESAGVYPDVSDQRSAPTNSFLLTIPPTFLPEASDIDAGSVTQHIHEFQGRVIDPSRASVSRAWVQVFRKSSPGAPVAETKADSGGMFADSLAPGISVAFVSNPGFVKQFVGFEIGPSGGANYWSVEVRIGHC
jgi:hypothetical protein